MTILECLNELPDEMKMIDLAELNDAKRLKTVAELKEKYRNDKDLSYEVRKRPTNYGRAEKVSIGIIGGSNMFNQE